MTAILRRVFVFLAVPAALFIALGADLRVIGDAWCPAATFAAAWTFLFARRRAFATGEVDAATYGAVLLAYAPVPCWAGVVWGAAGLVAAVRGGELLRAAATSGVYAAVSLILVAAIVGLPLVFRRRRPHGTPGPLRDEREPIASHADPVLTGSAGARREEG